MKILFITGSRGEWGYIRPILELIDASNDLDYELCITNMHLLPSFGLSEKEILADGFKIHHRIYMSFDGYNHYSHIKSLGSFLLSMGDILASNKYDFIMLAGDRGEQLIAAIAGAYAYIPVGHIQAGEVSGNIDGVSRHAIGKMAHLHFASNEDAYERLVKLGEQEFRIFNTGAPQLDELHKMQTLSKEEFEAKHNFDISKPFFLLVQHPVTEEYEDAERQMNVTLDAIEKYSDYMTVVIMPNNDAGSEFISNTIKNRVTSKFITYPNISRIDYLTLLKNASLIIGNSSSGLLEAPTYSTPAVNIGRRQDKRIRGVNVIDVDYDTQEIESAIDKALSKDFISQLDGLNPYGDGKSSARILDIIRKTVFDNEIIIKELTY